MRISIMGTLYFFLAVPLSGAAGPDIGLFVNAARHVELVYSSEPRRGTYVAFLGEPLGVKIELHNSGDDTGTLASDGDELFEVWAFQDDGTFLPRDDGIRLPIEVRWAPEVRRRIAGLGQATRWEKRLSIAPGETVEWTGEISTASVPPGLYHLRVAVLGNDVINVKRIASGFSFEVRAPSSEDLLDITLRRASLSILDQDYHTAEAEIRGLLRMFPESVIGHQLLGDALIAQNRRQEARDSYQTALLLLERGLDTRLLGKNRAVDPELSRTIKSKAQSAAQ